MAELAPSSLNFPVVGIGGSAGGLEAVLKLFENMPPHPGMAFAVVLHLAPNRESNAAEIIQRACSLPVSQVKGMVAIEVDHVYVIPPDFDLVMNDGYLQLATAERAAGPAVAIDLFFRTLAQVHRNNAFGIILSGTGSDGAVGLGRVKLEGGITLAQSPDEAEHGNMPRAAIGTAMVDIVLPVAEMGPRLVQLWANAKRIDRLAPDEGPSVEPDAAPPTAAAKESALQDIMSLLRSYTRHDFRHYKRGTVLRRIERRLQVNGLLDLPSYRDFLKAHPKEATPLLQDMLISVTNFFRDPDAFDALAQGVLPGIIRDAAGGEQVRVWVPGCATGEECYSIGMLLMEEAQVQGRAAHLQIFATDIDERAIAVARRGVYPAGTATDVSTARLRQFFVKEQDRFRVTAELREPVLFATHNILRDPAFSRLDLICCRNLLIYLDQTAQASVLEMFHYALKPGGYLFLGNSESVDLAGGLFTQVDKKNRIYRADGGGSIRSRPMVLDRPGEHMAAPPHDAPAPRPGEGRRDAASDLHLQALAQVLPASVLIDAQHEVIHLSATAGRFMRHGGGVPSNNLLNNVDPDLRLELRTALFQSAQTGRRVRTRVVQQADDGSRSQLFLTVQPLPVDEGEVQRSLVMFEPVEVDADEPTESGGDDAGRDAAHRQMMSRAENEIRHLKLNLQETLERSALSDEELRAANEELQAINEELRSATEELETSKEELQSMNEELTTVNYELRMKVEERGQINDDLQNLIASSEIATVFVDSRMRIKRFTPEASRWFNLIAADVGRSLLDITNRLNYDELVSDAEAVFRDLHSIERRITTSDGGHLFARLLPYRTAGDKIDGAVLTFIDITELQAAEEKVRIGEERLRVAAATTNDFAILTMDDQGIVASWNAGAQRIFGFAEGEIVGRHSDLIFTPEDRVAGVPELERRTAIETGRAEDERWHQRKDGSRFYCSGVMTRIDGADGIGLAKIARDMTGSKRHELVRENLLLKEQQDGAQARLANELKDKFLAVMSHELKQPLNLIQVNAELLTRLPDTRGVPSALRIGSTIQKAVASQTRIVNDLLDLSRIQTGKLRLNRAPVDLDELVRQLAAAASQDLGRKNLSLELRSPGSLTCGCDRVRIEQVVWNLLNNAIKFSNDGGRIVLSLEAESDFARITVTDSGIGIPEEALPHVFDLFSQIEAHANASNAGLGIGLALVQELVVAHGGRVTATSKGRGQGASFSIAIPLSATAAPEGLPAKPELCLEGWRILSVDDDVDSLNAFAVLLRLEGAHVDEVDSAARALALLEQADYDLLLSDISMPEMDGCELIGEIRRRWPDRKLSAVAMSGYGRLVDVVRAKAAGFDMHVAKPTSIEDLKDALIQARQKD
ncbi:Protein-glutamate methylesterase [Burkholderiales bacterium 8X]|nr:Protein-glutamate methylesterase [Burkholderiales bacterium 8X]